MIISCLNWFNTHYLYPENISVASPAILWQVGCYSCVILTPSKCPRGPFTLLKHRLEKTLIIYPLLYSIFKHKKEEYACYLLKVTLFIYFWKFKLYLMIEPT